MLVVRWFRRRLLILSVSIVGFFISTFSAVLALDFSGPVVSVLDGDTIEVRTTNTLNVSASRNPNDTQKNGATRSIVRMGRRTFWSAINWDC